MSTPAEDRLSAAVQAMAGVLQDSEAVQDRLHGYRQERQRFAALVDTERAELDRLRGELRPLAQELSDALAAMPVE